MKGALRIAVTTDPELPVPPRLYGGIERIVHFLVEGLTERGHEVVLFGHRDSRVSCELVPYPGTSSQSAADTARNSATIVRRVATGRFDVVHSFGRLAYLTPLALSSVPKIMSYQRPITRASIVRARKIFGDAVEFTGCSQHLIDPVKSIGDWHVIYNGVPLSAYTFQDRVPSDAPVVFLGRLEEIKGPHLAIESARLAGRRIVIAGNIEPQHQQYFDDYIRPSIDGTTVTYVGPVGDRDKNELLGQAAALLMPILWDEPFGIVMAEALACGTPVIGFNRGAVPEIVEAGVTGFLVSDVHGLADGIRRIGSINRSTCRTTAEARFSDRVIVSAYESLYFSRHKASDRPSGEAASVSP
jgi:glycosyltransferase involved in cell wall biosynthesis